MYGCSQPLAQLLQVCAVFGIIKQVMRFRQFLLRGRSAADGEWNLVCLAWNIKRLAILFRFAHD